MGRRKIEIQPITHERNRSVTFLKRKNGLFKKAYELGVLCSVDVAVIIFEERPGHHVKLYQYCSSDVHNIVQRHLRFDGEKDTRTPHDFSHNKNDEVGDEDEDADDDDGARIKQNNKQSKPNGTNGSSIRPPISNGDLSSLDMDYRSSNARASPHSVGSNGSSSAIPVSGERHSASAPNVGRGIPITSNKRPRLAPIASELPDSHMHGAQSAPASISPNAAGPASTTYPYRLDVDLNYPPSGHLGGLSSSLPHNAAHPSLTGLYTHTNGLMSTQNSQPFIPQAPFDFSRHQTAPTLRSVTFPPHGSSQYGQQQQPQNMYSQHRQPQSQPSQMQSSNMFVELLNSSSDHGHTQSPSQFPGFDWPVHAQQPQQPRPDSVPNSQQQSTSNEPVNNWLDFLSGSSQAPSTQASSLPLPHGRPASNSVSSTRSMTSFAVPPSSTPSENLSPASSRRKRSRDDDGTGVSDFNEDDGDEIGRSSLSASNSNGIADSGGQDGGQRSADRALSGDERH